MKTFAEAFEAINPTIYPNSEVKLKELAASIIEDQVRRVAGIDDEARNSPQLRGYMEATLGAVASGQVTPHSGFFTMFLLGLIVGMEMEKADFAEAVGGSK